MTFVILSFDEIDTTQSAQIQRIVQDKADDWWHQQANVWIVKSGLGISKWRDLFDPILYAPPSTLVVLVLNETKGWAIRSPGGTARIGSDWLKKNYFGGT